MDTSMPSRIKELEAENRRLKRMYADEKLKAEIAREAIEKKW
jgi:putative transposase